MKTILITLACTFLIVMKGYTQVNADWDKNIDFTQYKTYFFAGWIEGSKLPNQFDQERIIKALNSELNNRQILLTDSTNASMAMVLYLVVDKKTSTTAYTNYSGMGGFGGRGWGAGIGGAGMGTSTTTYSDNDYLAGTLVVDFYNLEKQELLWQGVLQNTIAEKPEKREKNIPRNITKLMKKYPVKPVKK